MCVRVAIFCTGLRCVSRSQPVTPRAAHACFKFLSLRTAHVSLTLVTLAFIASVLEHDDHGSHVDVAFGVKPSQGGSPDSVTPACGHQDGFGGDSDRLL